MKLNRVNKGQKATMPCWALGGEGGFVGAPAPCDGLVISMTAVEANGCIFVRDDQLQKAGYVAGGNASNAAESLAEAFTKKELVTAAKRIGVALTGTKIALAERILDKS